MTENFLVYANDYANKLSVNLILIDCHLTFFTVLSDFHYISDYKCTSFLKT
jgi:hypothetical protein